MGCSSYSRIRENDIKITYINILSTEILLYIFRKLNRYSRHNVAVVCKYWREIYQSDLKYLETNEILLRKQFKLSHITENIKHLDLDFSRIFAPHEVTPWIKKFIINISEDISGSNNISLNLFKNLKSLNITRYSIYNSTTHTKKPFVYLPETLISIKIDSLSEMIFPDFCILKNLTNLIIHRGDTSVNEINDFMNVLPPNIKHFRIFDYDCNDQIPFLYLDFRNQKNITFNEKEHETLISKIPYEMQKRFFVLFIYEGYSIDIRADNTNHISTAFNNITSFKFSFDELFGPDSDPYPTGDAIDVMITNKKLYLLKELIYNLYIGLYKLKNFRLDLDLQHDCVLDLDHFPKLTILDLSSCENLVDNKDEHIVNDNQKYEKEPTLLGSNKIKSFKGYDTDILHIKQYKSVTDNTGFKKPQYTDLFKLMGNMKNITHVYMICPFYCRWLTLSASFNPNIYPNTIRKLFLENHDGLDDSLFDNLIIENLRALSINGCSQLGRTKKALLKCPLVRKLDIGDTSFDNISLLIFLNLRDYIQKEEEMVRDSEKYKTYNLNQGILLKELYISHKFGNTALRKFQVNLSREPCVTLQKYECEFIQDSAYRTIRYFRKQSAHRIFKKNEREREKRGINSNVI